MTSRLTAQRLPRSRVSSRCGPRQKQITSNLSLNPDAPLASTRSNIFARPPKDGTLVSLVR